MEYQYNTLSYKQSIVQSLMSYDGPFNRRIMFITVALYCVVEWSGVECLVFAVTPTLLTVSLSQPLTWDVL